jgi:glycosyltransferase involved in cell wall biosynthesis
MKLSIIIPVYNVELYLKECLDSIIDQNNSTIELILVNDGSTDKSMDICLEYSSKYDFIRVINQPNSGQSIARNTGLKSSKGTHIWFVDSDDFIAKDSLKIIYEYLQHSDVDLFSFSFENYIDKKIVPSHLNHFEIIEPCNPNDFLNKTNYFFTSPWVRIFKREFLQHHSITFIEGMVHEDDFFNYQCMNYAKKVQKIPDVLYFYRIRENSTTTSLQYDIILKRINSLFFVIKNLRKFTNLNSNYIEQRILAYHNFIIAIAENYCLSKANIFQKIKLISLVKDKIPKVTVGKEEYQNSKSIWLKKKMYNTNTYFYFVYLQILKFK